jgi:hypothetical protein
MQMHDDESLRACQPVADSERPPSTPTVYAYEVWIPNAPWGEVRENINERTLGRAKNLYWRRVTDAWPDIAYTDVRGRKVGAPKSSAAFLIGVRYRGIPDVRCGDRVTCGKTGGGVIVDFGGGGAWLEVLADAGWRGYVHPAECTFHPAPGVECVSPGDTHARHARKS